MSNSKEILLITDKTAAFLAIKECAGMSSRHKSTMRFLWRKRHEPDQIKKNPKKGQRKDKEKTIQKIRQQIAALQVRLDHLLRGDAPDPLCQICDKDPEGYDLPCQHSICNDCFRSRLIDGRMECTVCHESFEFEDDLI